jgi:hypothetical protein
MDPTLFSIRSSYEQVYMASAVNRSVLDREFITIFRTEDKSSNTFFSRNPPVPSSEIGSSSVLSLLLIRGLVTCYFLSFLFSSPARIIIELDLLTLNVQGNSCLWSKNL